VKIIFLENTLCNGNILFCTFRQIYRASSPKLLCSLTAMPLVMVTLFLAPLIFDIGDLNLLGLAKLWVLKLIMTKSNFKKSVMTSFQCRRHNYVIETVTKITSQIVSIQGLPQSKFLAMPVIFIIN